MPNDAKEELTEPDSKVLFNVPYDDGTDDIEIETLWAWNLGEDKYKLDNVPFYAYGVSCGDVVLAPYDEKEQFPTFLSVVQKCGNRTLRVIFPEDSKTSEDVLRELVERGCDYEGANPRYLAINVPKEVDFEEVVRLLINKHTQFEFADPTYREYYGDDE